MELLSSLHEIKVAESIKQVIETYNIRNKLNKSLHSAKKDLKNCCGIVYFSIISSSDNSLKIMAKTMLHSYFYDYNLNSKEIILVGGIRKNVVTN